MKYDDCLVQLKENGITDTMFLIEANKYIYQAIDYLYYKKQKASPSAIMEVMRNSHMKQVVEEFGGIDYLSILSDSNVSKNNVEIFCEKLKQTYTRAQLINLSNDKVEFLKSDKSEVLNPSELINSYEKDISELQTEVMQTTDIYKMGDDAEKVLEMRAESPNRVPGLEVGWNKFDYYTNGGQGGDLIMLCARAKTGKSTTLTNWATKLAIKDKIPILYFDTEMSSRQQEDRMLSILSGVPNKEIISGMYMLDTEYGKAEEKKEKIRNAIQELKEGYYYHIYMPNFTIDKVEAISKKYKLHNNVQAIFFDYLKFPSSQINTLKSVQEWQMLGYIASGLKDLAGTLDLPIYSGCQENRSNLDGKKDERNVGGSDRILQLASKLIFLSNKTEEEILKNSGLNGNQTLYIAYQRNGESDCPPIDIMFDKTRLTQSEV